MSAGTWSVVIDGFHQAHRTWSGGSTPRGAPYKELPYHLVYDHTQESPATLSHYNLWDDLPAYGFPYSAYFAFLWADMYYVSQADRNELYAKNEADLVGKIRGEFNLGVFAAELPEAIKSVVSSARALWMSYKYLRQGDVPSALRTLLRAVQGVQSHNHKGSALRGIRGTAVYHRNTGRSNKRQLRKAEALSRNDVASLHLSIEYAWKPLMSDIFGLMEEIEKWSKNRSLTYRKKSIRSYPNKEFILYNWEGGYPVSFRRIAPAYTSTCIIRRKWTLAEEPSRFWKLGLTNPLEVLWEKVPYSFVVDWLLPIGPALQAWSRSQLAMKSWTYSELFEVTCKQGPKKYVIPKSPSNGLTILKSGSIDRSKVLYDRWTGDGVYSGIHFSTGWATPPLKSWDHAFSTAHLTSAAALLNNFVKRG